MSFSLIHPSPRDPFIIDYTLHRANPSLNTPRSCRIVGRSGGSSNVPCMRQYRYTSQKSTSKIISLQPWMSGDRADRRKTFAHIALIRQSPDPLTNPPHSVFPGCGTKGPPFERFALPYQSLTHELLQASCEDPVDRLRRRIANVFLDIRSIDESRIYHL